MYFDEAMLLVRSGDGGDGSVHFRREKYVPHGGPDGGDGGRGGDVILQVDPKLNTLLSFAHKRKFAAENGGKGQGRDMRGKTAPHLFVAVPPGTVVRDAATDELLGDLTDADHTLVVVRGGRGGRGNARFATASNQTPRVAERGAPGEEVTLKLELKLIADIGIVGVPNAGKSTFLASVTAAKPKIAPYPFTTLTPNLGVADLGEAAYGRQTLILADIPGLIEGAHRGVGLGFDFLRHIQRTRVLIHLLDGAGQDPLADFSQINTELSLFDEDILQKPQIVALNKVDLPEAQERWPQVKAELEKRGHTVLAISAVAQIGVRDLLYLAARTLATAPAAVVVEDVPLYRPLFDEHDFSISREPDGGFRVSGKRIERAARMTYWEFDEAVLRFQNILDALGVKRGLEAAGVKEGDTVRIGEYELEWSD